MSTILLLCVLAAAVWLALNLRAHTPRSQATDSMEAYARALAALAPERPGGVARPPARRPRSASAHPSPGHPATARPARRPGQRPAAIVTSRRR